MDQKENQKKDKNEYLDPEMLAHLDLLMDYDLLQENEEWEIIDELDDQDTGDENLEGFDQWSEENQ